MFLFEGDPLAMLGLGPITGYRRILNIGNIHNVNTASLPRDVWGGTGFYPWLASAQALEIVSTDAADTAAGTGVRSVLCNLLDANFVESPVVVALNGLTPVPIPGGPYRRCNGIVSVGAGSGSVNAGVVTLRVAGGGTSVNVMQIGDGQSKDSNFTVPAGKTFSAVTQAIGVAQGATNNLVATVAPWIRDNSTGAARLTQEITASSAGISLITALPGAPIPEKTDWVYRILSNSSNDQVIDATILGILVDNEYR